MSNFYKDMSLTDALKSTFGYNTFRPYQEDIIRALLDNQDVCAILPTGSGKSLCYQLPAVIKGGTSIVVSPLIALMQDQVHHLNKDGIPAAYINSSLSRSEQLDILSRLHDYRLIYVAPERLFNEDFASAISATDIQLFVIDEAHCISEWGHSFRPEYRQLSTLKHRFPSVPVAAFTATATVEVESDIASQLCLRNPTIIKGSFDRPNLEIRMTERLDITSQLLDFVRRHPNESGIVYAGTRKRVEEIYGLLDSEGLSVSHYHAGLPESYKKNAHRQFVQDEVQVMVATVAFGLGIHKPDIRYVIHLDMPQNIEQYYQEIGRAGRDGLPAECLMIYSSQNLVLQKRLLEDIPDATIRSHLRKKTDQMFALASSVQCRRVSLLHYFGEQYSAESCGHCDNCSDTIEQIDGTEIAQKILSCVVRLHQNFGITYVINVLSGSKQKDILTRGHDQLSTYNLLGDLPKAEIRHYIFNLINMDYLLVTEGKYPLLKLTQKSRDILFDGDTVSFRKRVFKRPSRASRSRTEHTGDYDTQLFEHLRTRRLEIARKAGIAPFMVFHDKTLIDMCVVRPKTEPEFLTVNGVGQQKLALYGAEFIDAIGQYQPASN